MKLTVSDFPGKGYGPNARQMVELARIAEDVGIDRFGVSDYPFREDCTTLMAACLQATSRLELESLVTTPFRRAPDLTACAWATMAALSEGRAILGVGKGGGAADTYTPPWGWDRPAPLASVREMVEICRTMWGGGKPAQEGEILYTSGREMNFAPGYPIPVLVAARGPKMLRLAAEIADIVHIATPFLGSAYMAADVDRVHEAAEAAGRKPGDLEVDMTIALSVSRDREFARSEAKLIAAVGILWMANAERRDPSGELISKSQARKPSEFHVPQATVDAISTEWNMWTGEKLSERISALIDDDVLAQFAVAGTAEECRDRLLEIRAGLPGITGFRFKLPPVTGPAAFGANKEMIDLIGSFAGDLRSA